MRGLDGVSHISESHKRESQRVRHDRYVNVAVVSQYMQWRGENQAVAAFIAVAQLLTTGSRLSLVIK